MFLKLNSRSLNFFHLLKSYCLESQCEEECYLEGGVDLKENPIFLIVMFWLKSAMEAYGNFLEKFKKFHLC